MPRLLSSFALTFLVLLTSLSMASPLAASTPKASTTPSAPVGGSVGLDLAETSAGSLRVRGILIDGPAYQAGLRKDDTIDQVDGVEVAGRPAAFAVERIRGPKGTVVTLHVNGGRVVRVVRALGAQDAAAAWRREQMRPFEDRVAQRRKDIAALDRKLAKPVVPAVELMPFVADVERLRAAWRAQAARLKPQLAAASAANVDLADLAALAQALAAEDHQGVVQHGARGEREGDTGTLEALIANPAWAGLPPEISELRSVSRLLHSWSLAAAGDFEGAHNLAGAKDSFSYSGGSAMKARSQALAPRLAKVYEKIAAAVYWRKQWQEDRARYLEDLAANEEILGRIRGARAR